MRVILAVSIAMLVSACGQTGSLYLPDESVETPVEIRGPAQPAEDDEEEEKATQPPGS